MASPQRRRTGPSADRIGSRQNCLKQSRIGQNRPAVLLSQPRQGEPSAEQRRQAQIEQAASHAGKPAKSAGLMLLTYMYSFTFLKAKSLPVHVTSHSHNHPAGGPNPGQTFSIRPHAPVQAEPIVSDLSREEAGTAHREPRHVTRFAPATCELGAQAALCQTQCSQGSRPKCIWTPTPSGTSTQDAYTPWSVHMQCSENRTASFLY